MKKINSAILSAGFGLIAALFFPAFLYAQTTEVTPDSTVFATPKSPLKIMVIPFHPIRYYFSDCDRKISAKSKIELQEVRNNFRANLDFATEESLEDNYEPINLYQLKDTVSKEMLTKFYGNVVYTMDAPAGVLPPKQEKELKAFKEKLSESLLKPQGEKGKGQDEECYSKIETDNGQYMKAAINPDFLAQMNEIYHPDLYVTINQFEIKTDYEHCIDRDLGVFTRRIKVHYNIFSPQGKLMYGDAVTVRYQSNSDDFNKIIKDNFGLLSSYIARSIP